MNLFFCDYETYYDSNTYTLRKMNAAQYILDPRFEALGAGVAWNNDAAEWIDGPDLPAYFAQVDWANTAMVSHNIAFDGAILAWIYGCSPKLYIDTLGMARAITAHTSGKASLDATLKHFGLAPKMGTIAKMSGYRFAEWVANGPLYVEGVVYARKDTEDCRRIFKLMKPSLPTSEIAVLDMVARMAIHPQLHLNPALLEYNLVRVRARKQALLSRLQGVTVPELMSNDQFAVALAHLGVEPPTKISPVTGKQSFAFSKQDQAFKDLLEHDNADVQALVAARFGYKSTQEETRSQAFLDLTKLDWGTYGIGGKADYLPCPLKYSGAHTHRFSGDWGLNVQNLARDDVELKDARGNAVPHPLRQAIEAPEGYVVLQVDASQIEARMNAWLAGVEVLLEGFRNKEDVYASFASIAYGKKVDKRTHPLERFVGKTCILGLGYGMGWPRFKETVRVSPGGPPGGVILTDSEAEVIVMAYRQTYLEIPRLWTKAENLLHSVASGAMATLGPVYTRQDAITLPNGMDLRYHKLRREMLPAFKGSDRVRETWVYNWGPMTRHLFGGKVVENMCQSLARIVVMDSALRLRRRFPQYALAMQHHDALVYVVKESDAAWFLDECIQEMSVPPSWAHDLPLAAEGGYGATLAEAK